MSDDVVIVSATRTPVGAFNGAFANTAAHDLGAAANRLPAGVVFALVLRDVLFRCLQRPVRRVEREVQEERLLLLLRFIERRSDPADRRAWLIYLTPKAHPLIEVMRGNGHKTREEAFAGLSADAQQQLLQALCLIKSNLLEACTQPAVDPEKAHV